MIVSIVRIFIRRCSIIKFMGIIWISFIIYMIIVTTSLSDKDNYRKSSIFQPLPVYKEEDENSHILSPRIPLSLNEKIPTPQKSPPYDFKLSDLDFHEIIINPKTNPILQRFKNNKHDRKQISYTIPNKNLRPNEERDFLIFEGLKKSSIDFSSQKSEFNLFGFDTSVNKQLPLFRKWDLGDRGWQSVNGDENSVPVPRKYCEEQSLRWRQQAIENQQLIKQKEDYVEHEFPVKTTIIICFHDEPWASLIRTIYSAIHSKNSNNLINEIILIDDGSDLDQLFAPLEAWIALWDGRIKLLRSNNRSRQGLIRARLAGAILADQEKDDEYKNNLALTFLDAHCESAEYWLEPLIYRVALKKDTFVTPVIDVLSTKENFKLQASNPWTAQVGAFDMKLDFKWFLRQKETGKNHRRDIKPSDDINPINSPAMAGGLFTVMRNTFIKYGTYDKQMKIWGGENIEMSLRVWMCGGTIEVIPCSHVGHIFRAFNAHERGLKNTSIGLESEKNKARTALIWLDDPDFEAYKRSDPWSQSSLATIDQTDSDFQSRIRWKNSPKMQCKSSNWYFTNIFPELWRPNFHEIEKSFIEKSGYGRIKSLQLSNYCFQGDGPGASLLLNHCNEQNVKSSKYFYNKDDYKLKLYPDAIGDGIFGTCITAVIQGNGKAYLAKCDKNNNNQQEFKLKIFNEKALYEEKNNILNLSKLSSKLLLKKGSQLSSQAQEILDDIASQKMTEDSTKNQYMIVSNFNSNFCLTINSIENKTSPKKELRKIKMERCGVQFDFEDQKESDNFPFGRVDVNFEKLIPWQVFEFI